jgi:predicted phosphohydrolase
LRIVAISDTHGLHHQFRCPDGDVLIHAGDFMMGGQEQLKDAANFLKWFDSHPHPHKILIAGNHDSLPEYNRPLFEALMKDKEVAPSVTYLQDSGCEIDGIKFWGTPFSPEFGQWHFMLPRGPHLKRHWDMIPDDTDVLITHCPPYGILDRDGVVGEHCGCSDLLNRVYEVQPRFHIFGHIHAGYGSRREVYFGPNWTDFINASIWWHDEVPRRVKNAPIILNIIQ